MEIKKQLAIACATRHLDTWPYRIGYRTRRFFLFSRRLPLYKPPLDSSFLHHHQIYSISFLLSHLFNQSSRYEYSLSIILSSLNCFLSPCFLSLFCFRFWCMLYNYRSVFFIFWELCWFEIGFLIEAHPVNLDVLWIRPLSPICQLTFQLFLFLHREIKLFILIIG